MRGLARLGSEQRALSRPRSSSPTVRRSGRRDADNSGDGVELASYHQLGGPVQVHWNRVSPSGNNVLFVGQNPPSNFPIYTHDPYLSCASRRWRMFELDARHGDFWNDPITVSLGLHPPRHNAAGLARTTSSSEPSLTSSAEHSGTGPNEHATNSASDPNASERVAVRANNNGELVFTELEDFQTFVGSILDSIARCMVDIDQNISSTNRNRNDQRTSFNAGSTVYGFTPMGSGLRPNMPVAFGFAEGEAVQMVAELITQDREATNNSDNTQQGNGGTTQNRQSQTGTQSNTPVGNNNDSRHTHPNIDDEPME